MEVTVVHTVLALAGLGGVTSGVAAAAFVKEVPFPPTLFWCDCLLRVFKLKSIELRLSTALPCILALGVACMSLCL